MQNRYFSYIDQRAAKRRLAAKFARPRAFAIHLLLFISVMTGIWAYGIGSRLFMFPVNYQLPTTIGLLWSVLLVFPALRQYRWSALNADRREAAVEEEMRLFIEKNGDEVDDETLFVMHQQMEADLENQGQWSTALALFALVNAISWIGTAANMGTSWGYQVTLPFALIVIGGVKLFLYWQQQRRLKRVNWFSRLPLWHMVLYIFGVIALGLMGLYRAINQWDANNIITVWGLVVVAHIVLVMALLPLIQRLMPALSPVEKQKHTPRLALAADGEIVEDLTTDDADAYLVERSRQKRG